MNFDDENPDFPSATVVSRTQRKHDALELKNFGEELVNLPAGKFEKLPLPDELRFAVIEARKITSRPARNRQLHIVGRMLQGVDIAAIRANLRDIDHKPSQPATEEESARSAAIEQLVEQLLSGDYAEIFTLTQSYAREALQKIRQAVRQAQKKLKNTNDRAEAIKIIRNCLEKLS